MATLTEARAQISAAFVAYRDATTGLIGMPIAWDNDDFNPKSSDKSTGYMRFTLQNAGGSAASLGNSHFRDLATVIIQCFTDLADGTERVDIVGEAVRNFLRTLPQGAVGIRVIDPGIVDVGPDGVWYQTNVTATISYDSHV